MSFLPFLGLSEHNRRGFRSRTRKRNLFLVRLFCDEPLWKRFASSLSKPQRTCKSASQAGLGLRVCFTRCNLVTPSQQYCYLAPGVTNVCIGPWIGLLRRWDLPLCEDPIYSGGTTSEIFIHNLGTLAVLLAVPLPGFQQTPLCRST